MSDSGNRDIPIRNIAAVVILVVGVGVAVRAVWKMRAHAPTSVALVHEDPDAYVWGDNPVSVRKDGAEAVAVAARARVLSVAESLNMKNADELAADLGEIVLAWFGGTGDDYLAYLAERGHEPPPADFWNDPAKANERWKNVIKYFGEVSIDPGGIKIVERFTDGREVTMKQPRSSSHAWRYDKLSVLSENYTTDDIAIRANLTVREIEIPIRMDGYSGEQFEGQLGLTYAWDKGTRAWVLVRVAIFDYPNGEAVVLPPF